MSEFYFVEPTLSLHKHPTPSEMHPVPDSGEYSILCCNFRPSRWKVVCFDFVLCFSSAKSPRCKPAEQHRRRCVSGDPSKRVCRPPGRTGSGPTPIFVEAALRFRTVLDPKRQSVKLSRCSVGPASVFLVLQIPSTVHQTPAACKSSADDE